MRDLKELRDYWAENSPKDLILCTIVKKSGSGYRGVGAKKIVQQNGDSCGYLSGGCLEGDIIRSALDRWDQTPFVQSFSTMSEEDRLMGYQTGCAGIIDILFEPLPAEMSQMDKYMPFGAKNDIAAISVSLDPETLGQRIALEIIPERSDDFFIDPWVEPLALYVLGCGANARPFAEIGPPLGWDVTFLDYRQGNVLPETQNIQSRVLPLHQIADAIAEGPRTAVIIMTHNYEADLSIVGQLNGKSFGYIGAVGPRKRFQQMKEDLRKIHKINLDEDWVTGVHAPAGLKQGRTPEDIAFSIIAEIQFGMNA